MFPRFTSPCRHVQGCCRFVSQWDSGSGLLRAAATLDSSPPARRVAFFLSFSARENVAPGAVECPDKVFFFGGYSVQRRL